MTNIEMVIPGSESAKCSEEHNVEKTGEDENVCLYAIVPLGIQIEALAGLDLDRPVYVIEGNDLAAIVSLVREAYFNQQALKTNLQNIDWLRIHATRFQTILDRVVATQQPLIPLRFCTIYRSEADIQAILTAKGTALKSELERLRGRQEWGLKLRLNSDVLRQTILTGAPLITDTPVEGSIAALQSRIKKMPTGSAFLLQKQLEQEIKKRIESLRAYYANQSHSRIKQFAVDFVASAPDAHDRSMVLQVAYLVDQKDSERFLSEVDLLTTMYSVVGLQYELSGPWPAYNFLNAAIGA